VCHGYFIQPLNLNYKPMKTTAIILLLLLVGVFSQAQPHLYSSKSGKLAYNYELGGTNTHYILFFDDFGKKQAFELESTVDGYSQKSRTIITPETIFIISYEDEQVITFPVDADDEFMSMYGGDNGGFDLSRLVADVTREDEMKRGSGMVMGKNCAIYEYTDEMGSKGKYWIYNGYLFKAEFLDEEGRHAFMQVTDFKIDATIDKKEFEVPTNFAVTDMTQMMEKMKQMQELYGIPDEE
jgi:outer membrane lipoprotein-sorting protein